MLETIHADYGHRSTDDVSMGLEPVGFTGKEADEEVGLVYFGERYLLPRLGRWASVDPLSVHSVGGGEALNGYQYVGGNLLQARDPLGLQTEPSVLVPDVVEDRTPETDDVTRRVRGLRVTVRTNVEMYYVEQRGDVTQRRNHRGMAIQISGLRTRDSAHVVQFVRITAVELTTDSGDRATPNRWNIGSDSAPEWLEKGVGRWEVDSTDPSGRYVGVNTRDGGNFVMHDAPGASLDHTNLGTRPPSFVVSLMLRHRVTEVQMTQTFQSFIYKNGRVIARVDWQATTTFRLVGSRTGRSAQELEISVSQTVGPATITPVTRLPDARRDLLAQHAQQVQSPTPPNAPVANPQGTTEPRK